MKKSLVILVSLGLIFLLSMSVVSASWFGDIWKKITGKTTENDTSGTGCADECSIGNKRCSGNYNYQICGNYDSDSCTEWLSADSPASSCPPSEICVQGDCVSNTYTCDDSDGGKDYNVKGRVTASSPTSSTDVTDLCSGSTGLVEYFCTPDKSQSGETYTCPNGCSNGACVSSSATTTTTANQTTNTATTSNQTTSVSCADSDGGKNYNVQGRTTATSGDITDITEVCSGKYVIEHSCASTGLIASEYYLCANGCSNGACVSGTTTLNQTTSTTTTSIVAAPTTSTTTTTSVSAGASSGGRTASIITESPEGIFEEKTITEEKFEGEIKITTEAKKFTDRAGNKVDVEVKTEIKEDGTTITEEKREFINKDGRLIKLKFIFENDGENIKIKREVEVEGNKIKSELEISEKFEGEEVKLKAKLSNGEEQEIKIMPDRASEIAIEQLKSKNFNVELKEVGEGENLKAVYIANVDETGKLLGLFKVKLKSEMQIDSETGEILNLEKQWWNFLTIKLNEPLTLLGNQTGNNTNITLPPPVNITINNTNNVTNITLPAPINQTNLTLPKNQTNLTSVPVNLTNFTINNQTATINTTISCTDSDGGKNYNVKGNTISISSTGTPGNVNDYCSGTSVIEYFCMNVVGGNVIGGESYKCPNGCSNGACV